MTTTPPTYPRSAAARRLRRLGLVLLLALLAAVVAAVVALVAVWDAEPDTAEFELTKTLMQALLVVLVGAVLTFLGTQYQARQTEVDDDRANREKETAYRRSVLMSVLERTTASYTTIKQARRLLRAQGRRGTGAATMLVRERYDAIMELVSETQLGFETLAAEVRTTPSLFASPDALIALFDGLEGYLGTLVSEYERQLPRFGRRRVRPLAEFVELSAFVEKAPFGAFSGRYHAVQASLRGAVDATLPPRLARDAAG